MATAKRILSELPEQRRASEPFGTQSFLFRNTCAGLHEKYFY
jgi:hypothetical protein